MDHMDRITLWIHTIVFAIIMYVLAVGYGILYQGVLDAAVLSEAFAFSGGILIGCSFVLSSVTYFFNFLDSKLKYRKMLGLVGYYIALAYSLTLLLRNLDLYWNHPTTSLLQPEALLGLSAMAIFTFMAVISGNWAVKLLGTSWRAWLRTGYIAYLLLVIRAFSIEGEMWRSWAMTRETVPSLRLVLTVFALMVIYARIGLEIALRLKKKTQVKTI
jgi:DMSO/TMAO reductase YedYZ heme-binding membrane subunit